MAVKKVVFISYDLGLKGDYNGLFVWLDSNEAVECGSGLAMIKREFQKGNAESIFLKLKNELSKGMRIESGDRIYAIVREKEAIKGKFLFGGRKQAPWTGYAISHFEGEDSD